MTDDSIAVELAKTIGPIVVVAVFSVLVLLGPVGWILVLVLVGVGLIVRGILAGDGERPSGHNCLHCGSRLDADAVECDYCGVSQ